MVGLYGVLGKISKTSIPDTRPSFATFKPENNTLDVIVQVSNFHHRKGGFYIAFYFGTEKGLFEFIQKLKP